MHCQDGPGHDASQGEVSAARRVSKPAEDVEDVRLRSRLYSATSRPALLTCPGLRDARHSAVIGAWSQCDELLRESLPRLRIERRPASVDPNVATALRPPEFLESVPECRHVGM